MEDHNDETEPAWSYQPKTLSTRSDTSDDSEDGSNKEFKEKCSLTPGALCGQKRSHCVENIRCDKAEKYKKQCALTAVHICCDKAAAVTESLDSSEQQQQQCIIKPDEHVATVSQHSEDELFYSRHEASSTSRLDFPSHLNSPSQPAALWQEEFISFTGEGMQYDPNDSHRLRESETFYDICEQSAMPSSSEILPQTCLDTLKGDVHDRSGRGALCKHSEEIPCTDHIDLSCVDFNTDSLINGLPTPLLLQIFALLPLFDLVHRCTVVCKKWKELSYDPSLWRDIRLRGQVKVNDQILLKLASLSDRVLCLDITDSKCVSNLGLRHVLEKCTQLKTLKLVRCHQIAGLGLKAIGEFCPRLEQLYLDNCYGLSDEYLQLIASGCGQLRFLRVSQCSYITDVGVEAIAEGCRLLESLMMDHCSRVTDRGMGRLVECCPHLEQLSLMACSLSDRGVKLFTRLNKLKMLDVSNIGGVSKATVMSLVQHCSLLEVLDVSLSSNVDDECVEYMAKHGKNLKRLYLVSCNLTDKALVSLGEHSKKLVSLDLGWCQQITDHGVRALSTCCPLLNYIGLIRCDAVTAEAIEELMVKYPHIKYSTFKLESRLLLERARQQGFIVFPS